MAELRRAFLAVVPPPAIVRWTESLPLADGNLRWTRPTQRHLTVRFLGEVPDSERRNESFAESFLRCQPFSLSLGGGGAFPAAREASVLWVGTRQGSGALAELAAVVADAHDRPFVGHLTLARTNQPRDLRQVIAALDACGESQPWTVDEVVLYESDGSVHTEVARFRLAG